MNTGLNPDYKQPPEGGPAFPVYVNGMPTHEGMTLRDWLVGQVLSDLFDGHTLRPDDVPFEEWAGGIVSFAEGIADAYLRRRAERINKLKHETGESNAGS